MFLHSLALTLLASVSTPAASTLEMPPPPEGMRELAPEERSRLLETLSEEEAPEASPEVEAESAELEEMRALEEAELDPEAQVSAELLQSLRRMGLGNPLRESALDAFTEPLAREETGFHELPPVRNVAAFDASSVAHRYDIPVEMQPLVAQYIQFFQGSGRRWFRNWMNRSTRFLPLMQPILEQHGLPRDTVYLAMIESGFSANAYSWAHAAGPWQFIPGTGKQYGLEQNFWVDERRDPVKSTEAAAKYLKQLHRELGHWYLAWAGYNTGGGRVRRLAARKGTTDFWELSEGKGLAKETRHYVPKLIAAALIAKHPSAFGFREDEFDWQEPFTFDEVELVDPTDLDAVARAAGVPLQEVKDLNPELKRWCTPPASEEEPYRLRLPPGTRERFVAEMAKMPARERLTFRVHKVKRGDTLSQIAERYGSATEAIMHLNHLKSARHLRLNGDLVIPVPRGVGRNEQVALKRQVARARGAGVKAPSPAHEVPAGTAPPRVAAGLVRTEEVGGRTRVTYAVQEGDSLWDIAQRYGVTVEQLQEWNPGPTGARKLQVGSELLLWPAPAVAAREQSGTLVADKRPSVRHVSGRRSPVHRLKEGETLWSVSQRYGVTVDDIKRWNNIRNTRTLQVGQSLTVGAP